MLTNEEDYTVSIPKRIEELVIDDELPYMDAVIQTSDEMGVGILYLLDEVSHETSIVERIQSEAEDKKSSTKNSKTSIFDLD